MEKHIYDSPHMSIPPLSFYKCLADETRLLILLLIHQEKELCVCELKEALNTSQPKVSRHLAQLRECGLLEDRRESQWVYYRINPGLPQWAKHVIETTAKSNPDTFSHALHALHGMGDRPQRKNQCCN